jgi:hypothetical protein
MLHDNKPWWRDVRRGHASTNKRVLHDNKQSTYLVPFVLARSCLWSCCCCCCKKKYPRVLCVEDLCRLLLLLFVGMRFGWQAFTRPLPPTRTNYFDTKSTHDFQTSLPTPTYVPAVAKIQIFTENSNVTYFRYVRTKGIPPVSGQKLVGFAGIACFCF